MDLLWGAGYVRLGQLFFRDNKYIVWLAPRRCNQSIYMIQKELLFQLEAWPIYVRKRSQDWLTGGISRYSFRKMQFYVKHFRDACIFVVQNILQISSWSSVLNKKILNAQGFLWGKVFVLSSNDWSIFLLGHVASTFYCSIIYRLLSHPLRPPKNIAYFWPEALWGKPLFLHCLFMIYRLVQYF